MEIGIAQELFDVFYPIGTYYETDNVDFNPNTNDNWYGEWVEDTKGYTTVGHDPNQTEFNVVGKKIGEKYHQLTIPELPKHHFALNNVSWGGNTEGHTVMYGLDFGHGNQNYWNYSNPTLFTNYLGNDIGHNNIQPSVVVKRWHRIA